MIPILIDDPGFMGDCHEKSTYFLTNKNVPTVDDLSNQNFLRFGIFERILFSFSLF